ncbi:aldehyde dehydrogenase (NADP(+)) [Tunturiibacter lichenicola]|uniref:aldehyde dehydrogenase (NADP(+)) n=1 Tax=Tunturiibacter lichenicola TaxID=2051959 RepID=UPI0021B40ED5|nr:aldehyde dehydrogenase (NADP(+)) [Edaphobacter lichenicola]
MKVEQVWIAGEWRDATSTSSFSAVNPSTGAALPEKFPISDWTDCDFALNAAVEAARALRTVSNEDIALFLEGYANEIERSASEIVAIAHAETGLPIQPRLSEAELPRTATQLRQAAAAAREGSWQDVVIDTKTNIRSHYAPIGSVVILGPNNFPFAFNGVSGGDFAAAIAAGCPVIAKSHPLHPGTTKILAECAARALRASKLPKATVQMLYNISNVDGLRLVADPRVGATSFTGSRAGGLRLKAAADAAGKPIYLEMSSLNPVVLLPGAIAERGEKLAGELADSCLAASGQMCTSPNLILAIAGDATSNLARALAETLQSRPSAPLFSEGGLKALDEGVKWIASAGAEIVTGGARVEGEGWRYKNTMMQISGKDFLAEPEKLQHEAFGNATLFITLNDVPQLVQLLETLEGNLTGSIYSSSVGADDHLYDAVAQALRFRVGRLLNDKVPTGVALSPAMGHGGPFPSTSHPAFTAVGIPRSILRFGALHCYDNVREERLPDALRNQTTLPHIWRTVDGTMIRG